MFSDLQVDVGLLTFILFIVFFVIFNIAETFFPRRPEKPDLAFRWTNNILLTLIAFSTAKGTKLAFAWLISSNHIGILQTLNASFFISLVVAFLSFELADYLMHRMMHRVPLLWRLHAVHHADTEFDISVTYRSHPLASIFILCFRFIVITILGAPIEVVLIYEISRVILDTFCHSNIRLPAYIDNILRHFIVTPDFHRIHHSSNKFYTNSNYSSTIPWFDYLFKTYKSIPYNEHQNIQIGLEYFREKNDSRIDQLLLMPFKKSEFPKPNQETRSVMK